MLLYFAGLLGIAAVLQARSFFFVAFTIVGFLQPFMLLPAPLGFLVVGATSVVVYTASSGFPSRRSRPGPATSSSSACRRR